MSKELIRSYTTPKELNMHSQIPDIQSVKFGT